MLELAPILQYPPPEEPWNVVAMDLLQFPVSYQGSRYLLVCVDHFSRFVILAPLQDETAGVVEYILVLFSDIRQEGGGGSQRSLSQNLQTI